MFSFFTFYVVKTKTACRERDRPFVLSYQFTIRVVPHDFGRIRSHHHQFVKSLLLIFVIVYANIKEYFSYMQKLCNLQSINILSVKLFNRIFFGNHNLFFFTVIG